MFFYDNLPRNLLLMRHARSKANKANSMANAGDDNSYTDDLLNQHNSQVPLDDLGWEQIIAASNWLKENGFVDFDGYYVSEHTRAIQSAGTLGLPNALWQVDAQLHERNYGLAENLSEKGRQEKFPEHIRRQNMHRFYSPWPDGETMADVCNRLRNNIINTLRSEMANKQVIIVSHGDVMRAFRIILENIPAETYHKIISEDQKWFKIGNCQVIHYTRVNPNDSTEVLPHLGWVRSVNPYDPTFAGHDWQPIVRKKYTNAELLALAERSKRLVNK